MSEHEYKFGDPVWVKINGQHEEWKGFFIREDSGMHHVAYKRTNALRGEAAHFTPSEIRPRPVTPAPTGWRLPEPGDVVRVHGSGKLRKITKVDWTRSDPIITDDGLCWYVTSCELVPPVAEAATPEEPKADAYTLSEADRREALGCLSFAAESIEMASDIKDPSLATDARSLIVNLIDRAAKLIGADS